MAEAQITLKFSPSEFDLLREALEEVRLSDRGKLSLDSSIEPSERNKARQRSFQLEEILNKLR